MNYKFEEVDGWLTLKECMKIRKKLLSTFSDLKFVEETHKYTLDNKPIKSTSSIIDYYKQKFDTEGQAKSYAEARGLEAVDVISAWEGNSQSSLDQGHKVHAFGENYINSIFFDKKIKRPIPTSIQELAIQEFWVDILKHKFIYPLVMELKMYSRKYWYAGTADIICIDRRNGDLIIMDYKTNKEIFDKAYNNLQQEPFLEVPQNSFSAYTLQFSFYQLMLEEAGYKCSGRRLIWLQKDEPNRKLYHMIKTSNVVDHLKVFLSKGIHKEE